VHSLSLVQPFAEMQSSVESSEQGVAVPPQYGMPDPGPPRSHQPATLQCVRAKQSESEMHAATQTIAPMQNELAPKAASHVALAEQPMVHCLCPM
jgi:hypothetical protein